MVNGSQTSGMHSYVISRSGAAWLLKQPSLRPLSCQLDTALVALPWGLGKRWSVALDSPLFTAPPSQEGSCDSDVQTIAENAFTSLTPEEARALVAGEACSASPRKSAIVRVELSLEEHPEVLARASLFRREAEGLGVELATVSPIEPTEIISICGGPFMVRAPAAPARFPLLFCSPLHVAPRLTYRV